MFSTYLNAALARAKYDQLDEGEGYFGSIPDFHGAWTEGSTLDECRAELAEVVEEWILFRLAAHMELPAVDGLRLPVPEVA